MAIRTRIRSLFRPSDQHALTGSRRLVDDFNRRGLLRGAVSLGALTMLTGCDVSEIDSVQKALRKVSAWNDGVQETIFRTHHLAPLRLPTTFATPIGARGALTGTRGFNCAVGLVVFGI
jgi:hypothetical protein